MSLREILSICLVSLGTCAAGFAQQPQAPAAPGQDSTVRSNRLQRMDRARREFRGRRPDMLGLGRAMDLTEEQRQQQRAIMQRYFTATKTQREELFKLREKRLEGNFTTEDQARAKSLHQEMRNSMSGIRGDMLGILTPEQRTQMETLRKEHVQKREEMMRRRQPVQQKPQLN
jgi:Spy/CpxP family protein refolding chaperone